MFGKNKKTEKDIILDQRTNEVYEVEVSEKELKERKKKEKQEQKQRAKEEKARLKKIKKATKKMKVPKTVQDTIPYISVYEKVYRYMPEDHGFCRGARFSEERPKAVGE